jgi:hypothetical protein
MTVVRCLFTPEHNPKSLKCEMTQRRCWSAWLDVSVQVLGCTGIPDQTGAITVSVSPATRLAMRSELVMGPTTMILAPAPSRFLGRNQTSCADDAEAIVVVMILLLRAR